MPMICRDVFPTLCRLGGPNESDMPDATVDPHRVGAQQKRGVSRVFVG